MALCQYFAMFLHLWQYAFAYQHLRHSEFNSESLMNYKEILNLIQDDGGGSE